MENTLPRHKHLSCGKRLPCKGNSTETFCFAMASVMKALKPYLYKPTQIKLS